MIAFCGAVVALAIGLVSPNDLLGVIANPAPATIGAMFVLSAALVRTGVLEAVSDMLRRYPVRELAERLGVSTNSIYTWQKQFSRPAKVIPEVDAQADEIRRLKRDLLRVREERDILEKATAYFARESPLSRM